MLRKSWRRKCRFSDCVSRQPCQQREVSGCTDRHLSEYERLGNAAGGTTAIRSGNDRAFQRTERNAQCQNRIAEIEQEFLQLNPEQQYFEEYYASYSDTPMESLDKLSSQKLLALWMEFEQHAECETLLGPVAKKSPSCSDSTVMRSNCFSVPRNRSFPICRVSFIR